VLGFRDDRSVTTCTEVNCALQSAPRDHSYVRTHVLGNLCHCAVLTIRREGSHKEASSVRLKTARTCAAGALEWHRGVCAFLASAHVTSTHQNQNRSRSRNRTERDRDFFRDLWCQQANFSLLVNQTLKIELTNRT
jgi:hypothetical protein